MPQTQTQTQSQDENQIRLIQVRQHWTQLQSEAKKQNKDFILVNVNYKRIEVVTYLNPFRRVTELMARIGFKYAGESTWVPIDSTSIETRVRRVLEGKGWEEHIEEHMRIALEVAEKLRSIFPNSVIAIQRYPLSSKEREYKMYVVM